MKKQRKIAIITGGASGIGFSIAQKFVSENIFCILIGRNKGRLATAKAKLKDNCATYAFDLTNLKKIPDLIQRITTNYKKIDILVNNAGIHIKKPLLNVSDIDFQTVLLTNLTAVFSLSREAGKIMIKQESGNILNISSMAATYGIPQVVAYTAAKSGVEGITRAMAVELSPLGIRINCIAPGFIETQMSSKALENDSKRKHKVLDRTPMKSLGSPSDIANAAYFLVSENAKFITGTILRVDGGNSIGF